MISHTSNADDMITVLFSHEGKHKAYIRAVPNREDDGHHFVVDVTGKEFDSQRQAISNARKYLKKKRAKFYKKNPRKWVKVNRRIPKEERGKSPIKTLHKLYKMKKKTAQILVAYSNKKLKLKPEYSRKAWDKKTAAIFGETQIFNLAIAAVMQNGTAKERKAVSKMLIEFTHEPFKKSNLFY
jgi:hypothetical protein